MDFMENRLSKFENDIANQFGHNVFYNNVLYAYFIICWKNVIIRVFYFWWQRIVESCRAQSFWWPPESVIYEHVSVPVYDSCRLSLSLSRDHPSRGEDQDEIQVFWVCPWQQCCLHQWRATGADQVSSSRGEFQTSLLPTYQSWAEVRSKETSKSERQRNRKATVTDLGHGSHDSWQSWHMNDSEQIKASFNRPANKLK